MTSFLIYPALFLGVSFLAAVVISGLSGLFKGAVYWEVTRPEHRDFLHVRGRPQRLVWGGVFALILSLFVSWLVTERLVYGLGGVFLLPALTTWLARRERARLSWSLDQSALSYLYALNGLVQAGLSLPSALFRLSENVPAPFASTLQSFLSPYEGGKSLNECLSRFRAKSDLRVAGTCLAMLEMAYRQGLPIAGLLERVLPILEAEHESRERVRSLRRATWLQVGIVIFIPWALGWVLHSFQPDLVQSFVDSSSFFPVVAIAVSFETVGAWVIWKTSAFY